MHTVLNITKNQEVTVNEGETICDGFSREGIELPHGCLAGSCGTCLIEIVEAKAGSLNEPKTIEKDTLETIYKARNIPPEVKLRLSCRARVQGPLKFKIANYTSSKRS